LTPKKRRQIGMIVKHNHFTTASEMKAQLKEKNPELEVSERNIRRELKNFGFVSVHPRKVPLLTQKTKVNRLSWARDHVNYNRYFPVKLLFLCFVIPFLHGQSRDKTYCSDDKTSSCLGVQLALRGKSACTCSLKIWIVTYT
jgi:hypothetical protein